MIVDDVGLGLRVYTFYIRNSVGIRVVYSFALLSVLPLPPLPFLYLVCCESVTCTGIALYRSLLMHDAVCYKLPKLLKYR